MKELRVINNLRLNRNEALVSCLLFLFPIAGNTVKSWTGAFFWLLVLFALFAQPWRLVQITKLEKLILWVVLAIFLTMVGSSLVNGWNELASRGLGVQIRYLGFVAVYFLLRAYPDSWKWLVFGSIAGAVVLLGQCLYDIIGLELDRGYGLYGSPGLIAIQSLIFMLVMGTELFRSKPKSSTRTALLLGLFAAFATLILSGSRSTYVTVLVSLLVVPFLFKDYRSLSLKTLGMTFVVILGAYYTVPTVNVQAGRAISDIEDYFSAPTETNLKQVDGNSVRHRLEMWRTSILIFKDHPIIGVSWRQFPNAAKDYVDQGLANPASAEHPHPHNTYLEFLVSHGLIGLSLLMAVLILPLQLAHQYRRAHPVESKLLTLFIVIYAINGINEGGTFIYGNAVSFFFVYFAAILALLVRQTRADNPRSQTH